MLDARGCRARRRLLRPNSTRATTAPFSWLRAGVILSMVASWVHRVDDNDALTPRPADAPPNSRCMRAFGWRLDPTEPLVSTAEVAERLGLDGRHVSRWFRLRGVTRFAIDLTPGSRRSRLYRWPDFVRSLERPDVMPWVARDRSPSTPYVEPPAAERMQEVQWIREALALIMPRRALAVVAFCVGGATCEELGLELGVSAARANQIIVRGLRDLRSAYRAQRRGPLGPFDELPFTVRKRSNVPHAHVESTIGQLPPVVPWSTSFTSGSTSSPASARSS